MIQLVDNNILHLYGNIVICYVIVLYNRFVWTIISHICMIIMSSVMLLCLILDSCGQYICMIIELMSFDVCCVTRHQKSEIELLFHMLRCFTARYLPQFLFFKEFLDDTVAQVCAFV